jgi:hypothetical protein
MQVPNRLTALVRSAQDTIDSWRRDPKRPTLLEASERAEAELGKAGVISSALERHIFRRVLFAIQANKGHGYTNPRRLLEIVQDILEDRDALAFFAQRNEGLPEDEEEDISG